MFAIPRNAKLNLSIVQVNIIIVPVITLLLLTCVTTGRFSPRLSTTILVRIVCKSKAPNMFIPNTKANLVISTCLAICRLKNRRKAGMSIKFALQEKRFIRSWSASLWIIKSRSSWSIKEKLRRYIQVFPSFNLSLV